MTNGEGMRAEARARIDRISDAGNIPVSIIRFSGDISSSSHDAILGSYAQIAKSDSIILDFLKTDYVNSSGIALVIQMMLEAGKSGQNVAIFGLSPHFQKVFTMVGIGRYAVIAPDEAQAIAAVQKA
jgi:anti-sigma B factor antagonist